jgi:hypothetical protein
VRLSIPTIIISTIIFFLNPHSKTSAEIIECIDPKGSVVFSNSVCPDGFKVKKNMYEIGGSPVSNSFDNTSFEFDGFYWKILKVHRFKAIGRESNLQRPKNDYFLVIEAQLKNISAKPRYITNSMILINKNQQYETNTKVSVYAEHQIGYENAGVKIEPGVIVKEYFGFDVKAAYDFELIISEWGTGSNRIKINIQ